MQTASAVNGLPIEHKLIPSLCNEWPFGIALLQGSSLVVEYVNKQMLVIWQKEEEHVLGRPLFEILPALRSTAGSVQSQLSHTKQRFTADEVPLKMVVKGLPQTGYFNIIVDPLTGDKGDVTGYSVVLLDITGQVQARKELQKQEERLRLITDAVPSLICYVDKEERYQFANKTYERWFGQPSAEIMHRTLRDVLGSEAYVTLLPAIRKALSGEACSVESVVRYKDGSERFVHADYMPQADSNGEGDGYYAMITDITERKKVEKESDYRKALLEAQSEAIPDAILVVDTKGQMLSFNKHFAKLWQIPASIIEAKDDEAALAFAMTQVADPEGFIRRVTDCYARPHEAAYDIVPFKDGRIIERHGNAVIANDGTNFGWIWHFRDKTETILKEEALRQSEEQFRSLANAMPQVVWIAEADGAVSYFNNRVEALNGAVRTADGKWAWQGMVHPADTLPTELAWQAALQSGNIYQMEHRIQMKDGSYRWYLSRGIPQRAANGSVTRWYGTSTDIHEQKSFSEKLEALVAERTAELQRSNEDLQQFAHVASHDLKEPVRKVMTFANRLKEEMKTALSDNAVVYLSKIEASAIRMYAMIDGVLLYSSLNALEQTKESIDLTELMKSVESDLEVPVAQKDARIICDDLPPVTGSPILLYQLFYNLTNNALKFSKPDVNPVIRVSGTRLTDTEAKQYGAGKDKLVKIVMQDNGIGFNTTDGERIFNAFTRLHSKDQFEGTGLGLSLCKKIVERHGGKIWATGEKGEGAVFSFLLPVE